MSYISLSKEGKYSPEDANHMDWGEVSELVEVLVSKISSYGEKINVIAPLLRTGGIVGGLLSIKMKVLVNLPVQFKYSYNPTTINQILSIPDILVGQPEQMNILLCEGNTSSGSIAVRAAKSLKEKYPDSKIYLATLTKVFGGPEKLEGIEEVFYGRLTDENFKASEGDFKKFNLRKGITIFPWETMEDELSDLNAV